MDTAKHVPLTYFSDDWLPAMTRVRPQLFSIAEVFDESGPGALKPYLNAGFTSTFNFPLRRAIIDVFGRGESTNRIGDLVHDTIDILGIEGATRLVNFVANHDVPRWFEEVRVPADAPEVEPSYFVDRYRLALVATFTLPGIPQLYYGDELGLRGRWPRNRRDMPSWAFSGASRRGPHSEAIGDPADWFALNQRLISLRAQHPALQEGMYAELWRQNAGPPVYAFLRSVDADRVIVLFNAGDDPAGPLAIPIADNPGIVAGDRAALADGTVLVDLLGYGAPETTTIEDGHLVVDLPALTAGIYVMQ